MLLTPERAVNTGPKWLNRRCRSRAGRPLSKTMRSARWEQARQAVWQARLQVVGPPSSPATAPPHTALHPHRGPSARGGPAPARQGARLAGQHEAAGGWCGGSLHGALARRLRPPYASINTLTCILAPCPGAPQTLNLVWKRNRNQHARLLLAQLRTGVLEAPFDNLPPESGLPTLQPWTLYRQGGRARLQARPDRPQARTHKAAATGSLSSALEPVPGPPHPPARPRRHAPPAGSCPPRAAAPRRPATPAASRPGARAPPTTLGYWWSRGAAAWRGCTRRRPRSTASGACACVRVGAGSARGGRPTQPRWIIRSWAMRHRSSHEAPLLVPPPPPAHHAGTPRTAPAAPARSPRCPSLRHTSSRRG